jgi:hypothetical protein
MFQIGCESREERLAREDAERIQQEFSHLPVIHDDITAEQAEAIAKRLLQEQQDAVYIKALALFSEKRYIEAVQMCRRDGSTANSMILFLIGRSVSFSLLQGEGLYSEKDVLESYLEASKIGNPYAMSYLESSFSFPSSHPDSSVTWPEKALSYWLLRKESNDPDALYCLGFTDAIGERQANIITSAWLGHPAALLNIFDGQELRKWVGRNPEISNWQPVVLEKLKALADSGNPLAQFRYGIYYKDLNLLEKAAHAGVAEAAFYVASYYAAHRNEESAQKAVYFALLGYIIRGAPYSFEELDSERFYYTADKKRAHLSQEIYKKQLYKVLEWYKLHQYPYRYSHPMRVLE